MELWVFAALAGAMSNGVYGFYQKYYAEDWSALSIAYQANIVTALFLLPVSFFIGVGRVTPELAALILLSGLANAASFYVLARALEEADLIVVFPIRYLTPVAAALTEPLVFAATQYSVLTIVSSSLAVAGTSLLAFSRVDGTDTDNRLLGAALAGFSMILILVAVFNDRNLVSNEIEPTAYAGVLALSTASILFVFVLRSGDSVTVQRELIPLGIFRTLSLFFIVFALSLTTGTNVNIVLALSVVVSTGLGTYVLDEEFTPKRIAGALLVFSSIVLAVL